MAFYSGSFKKTVIYLRLLKQLELVVHWFLFFDQILLIIFQTCVEITHVLQSKKTWEHNMHVCLKLKPLYFSPHCRNMIKTILNIQ
jgi:hypothetical protein